MNNLSRIVRKTNRKSEKNVNKISMYHNGNLKTKDDWLKNRVVEDVHSKKINGKWSSRISNDSAFCSTETGIIDSFGPLDDDDHQKSDLSLDQNIGCFDGRLDGRMESINSIDMSKSTEELSQSRLSIDGSSCNSLPPHLGRSLLSICETNSKKTSLENIFSNSEKRKIFKRSTSYEANDEPTTHVSFRQKIRNITKRSKQFINTRTDVSPSSVLSVASSDLDSYEIWATKHFVDGKYLDFQIKPSDIFLKEKLYGSNARVNKADLKAAVITPTKSDAPDMSNCEYQKCLLRSKAVMQSKPIHMFLFESLLIIAKQRYMGMSQVFRIKERISLILLWTSCDQLQPNLALPIQCPVTIGWSHRQIKIASITFDSLQDKLSWIRSVNRQQDLIAKSYDEALVIKVYCDDKEHGNRTKKIVVQRKETIDEVMKKVPAEFFPATSKETRYQISLKYVGQTERYVLAGSESIYAIQLASNNKWLSEEVEYFSIIPMKSGSFLKKSHSWKKSKQLTVSEHQSLPSKVENNSIIGRNLHDIFTEHNGQLPTVVLNLLRYLYKHGPNVNGIFRKSSNQKEVQCALESLDSYEGEEMISKMKPCVASSLLKTWLINMPDCLLIGENYDKWLETAKAKEHDRVKEIKKLVKQLPKENHLVLCYLVCVLRHITDNSEENKMTPHNLAVCLGPSILSSSTFTDYETEADSRKLANVVVETMISQADEIFGEDQCINIFLQSESLKHQERDTTANSEEIQQNFGSIESVSDSDNEAPPDNEIGAEPIESHITDNKPFLIKVSSEAGITTKSYDVDLENVTRRPLITSASNASEKRRNFGSQSISHVKSFETTCRIPITLRQEFPKIIGPSLAKHEANNIDETYCQLMRKQPQSNSSKKAHRKHFTMPDPRNFQFYHDRGINISCPNNGKPRYIVEVYINSPGTGNCMVPKNGIYYHQSIKSTRIVPREIPKVRNCATQCDTQMPGQVGFKTTIYLGPGKTSCIYEPPRNGAHLHPRPTPHLERPRTKHRSLHEPIIKQDGPIMQKYNQYDNDHYQL